jgi:MFS family permease
MYAIGIIAFILFLSTLIGVPVLPALSKELGADSTEIPIVVSAALITVVLTQFFSGFLADRFSKRRLLLIGALLGSISSFLCIVATNWPQLLLFRIIGGLADAITMPALLAVTATLGKDQPGKFFGILRGSQGLSFVVGPLVGSLFSLHSLRLPFFIDGLFSLVAFVVAFFLFQDTGKAQAEHQLSMFRGIKAVFVQKRVYLYLLLGISGMFSFGILYSFVPTKAEMLELQAWHIGLIIGGGAIIYSIVSYSIGALSDKFGRYPFVIAAQIGIMISGICLILSQNFLTLLLSYGLFCIAETITFLLSFVYASAVFEKDYIGTSMGIFDSLMDLSLFVGPILAISLYKALGTLEPVFILAVFPAFLTLLAGGLWLSKDT